MCVFPKQEKQKKKQDIFKEVAEKRYKLTSLNVIITKNSKGKLVKQKHLLQEKVVK